MYDENTAVQTAAAPAQMPEQTPAQPVAEQTIPDPAPEQIPALAPAPSEQTVPAAVPAPAGPDPQTLTHALPAAQTPPPTPPAPPKPKEEESIFRPMTEPPDDRGIGSLAELNRLEVLRTELASSTFKPKIILSYETVSFNKACLELLPKTRYVNVLIDREKKRIIILPVNRHAKDALQWCGVTQAGDVKRRTCTARKFGEKLYDMMEWVKENRYRILAYYQQIEHVELLVFNLLECEMVVPEFITTKTGKVVRRGKVYLPGDIVGFGMPREEHEKANEVELDAHYTLSDKDVDVTISDVKIKGRIPNDEEIIMSQYQKEKPREVYANG